MIPNDTIHCKNPGHCPNHPVVKVAAQVPMELYQDTIATDTIPIIVAEIVPLKKIIHLAADSIQPVDVSLLSESTYHIPKINQVRIEPDIEQPMNIDLLCNSLVFTFMLALTAKYAIASAPSWANLFNELKQELS